MSWLIKVKVFAAQYHLTISQTQFKSSLRSCVFYKLTADQVLLFYWIVGSSKVIVLEPGGGTIKGKLLACIDLWHVFYFFTTYLNNHFLKSPWYIEYIISTILEKCSTDKRYLNHTLNSYMSQLITFWISDPRKTDRLSPLWITCSNQKFCFLRLG